jgi:hypothetical protein
MDGALDDELAQPITTGKRPHWFAIHHLINHLPFINAAPGDVGTDAGAHVEDGYLSDGIMQGGPDSSPKLGE